MQSNRGLSVPLLQIITCPVAAYVLIHPEAVTTPPRLADQAQIVGIGQVHHPLELRPTQPPRLPFFRRKDQDGDDENHPDAILTVDYSTCGFQNGVWSIAYKCLAGTRSCTDDGTYLGCCDLGSTCIDAFPTACIGVQGFSDGLCDDKGLRTMCCSEEQRGFCQSLTMSGTLTGIACGSESDRDLPGTILADPTDWSGVITTVTATARTTTISDESVFPGASSTNTDLSPIGETARPGSGPEDDEEWRLSTSAIVGGVVGALVVFILVVIAAVCCVQRKKGQEEKDLSSTVPPPLVYRIPENAETPTRSISEYDGYPSAGGYCTHSYTRSSRRSSTRSST